MIPQDSILKQLILIMRILEGPNPTRLTLLWDLQVKVNHKGKDKVKHKVKIKASKDPKGLLHPHPKVKDNLILRPRKIKAFLSQDRAKDKVKARVKAKDKTKANRGLLKEAKEVSKDLLRVAQAVNKDLLRVVQAVNKGLLREVQAVNKGLLRVVQAVNKDKVKDKDKDKEIHNLQRRELQLLDTTLMIKKMDK
jgi:hypothetical protein